MSSGRKYGTRLTPQNIKNWVRTSYPVSRPIIVRSYNIDVSGIMEISLFDNISSFDFAIKNGKYIAQPSIWMGQRALFPENLSSISKDIRDDDFLFVFRNMGDPSVDRIISRGNFYIVSKSDTQSITDILISEGFLALKCPALDYEHADKVSGDFSIVEKFNI